MSFVKKELPAQSYIYVEREVPYGPEIGPAMGSALGEIFGFVGQNGLTPLAMPMSVYTGMDPEILRFQGGVIVSAEDAAKASGNIKAGELPAGDALTITHVGAYDKLGDTHKSMWAHIAEYGMEVGMPIWEIYVDDPENVVPEKLRTEIYCALK